MDKWTRDWALMSAFFNGDEIASISDKLKRLHINNLVFCSMENRFARAGGLASVTTNILPYLKEANNIRSVNLMTPFYPAIMDLSLLDNTGKHFIMNFMNKKVRVEIYEYTVYYDIPRKGEIKEYYLKAEGFFMARNDLLSPYIYNGTDMELNHQGMIENSVFYCKAVPLALSKLNIRKDIVLHLHEWQTALISLTAKEAMVNNTLESCGTVQTIHNSYDSAIPWDLIARHADGLRRKRPAHLRKDSLTAYEIGLQMVDAPITTVSDNFARELTTDLLQTQYYAPHLQSIFKMNQIRGINNGMFCDFAADFPKRENHSIQEVKSIKQSSRKALLKFLTTYRLKERFGELTYQGKTISRLPYEVPVIVMSGRLDPAQKGYDILLRTIKYFAIDEIKVILIPLPTNNADLDYFYEIACRCKGNVTVFPSRIERGYHELQTGCTFGIMPSIYEPFGAAIEYMTSGTVNISRATGGLVDQIGSGCGFSYKEDPVYYTLDNIKAFIKSADTVQARKSNPLVQSMSDNLYAVLKKAVHLYQNKPDAYYQMIINSFKKAKQFNWEETAKKYYQAYEMISKT